MKNMIAAFVMILILTDCASQSVKVTPAKKKASLEMRAGTPVPEGHIRIHYYRYSQKYNKWGVHLWGSAIDYKVDWSRPVKFKWMDNWGAWVDIKVDHFDEKLGYLIHRGSTREHKNRSLTDLQEIKEIWIIQGVSQVFREEPSKAQSYLQTATLTGKDRITLSFNQIKFLRPEGLAVTDQAGRKVPIREVTPQGKKEALIQLKIDPQNSYRVSYLGYEVAAIISPSFIDDTYFYDGEDLGAGWEDNTLTMKLWAPLAYKVSVVFYDSSDQYRVISKRDMKKLEKGVWSYQEEGPFSQFSGKYYQYEVTTQGQTKNVLDPYAKGMALFEHNKKDPIGKAAIVDPGHYQVKDYARIPGYQKREDAVIYEIHVRDFTVDPDLQTKAPFGTYNAFEEKLGYLKDLGVTHIQLLPVQNYYYSDESDKEREMQYSARKNNYNWGYDPHSYFTPEGMYSRDPDDPHLRIKELKELINAIHGHDMGVILDVVYNHTCKTDLFENINPGYSYRQDENGEFMEKSGCGNDVASTHLMMRKLIIDSVKYWTKEYKVDGFRFDLMGLTDTGTMDLAAKEIHRLNPQALLLGEGWRMYNGPQGTKGADQGWMDKTDLISVFSDSYRETVKAFLTGQKQSQKNLMENIAGRPRNYNADDPGDAVQYIAAHDGLTWHDHIAWKMNLDPQADKEEIYKRLKLGNFMVLTSQGIAFLHGGQEMGRTKQWKAPGSPNGENHGMYIRNSYDSSDSINMIDWSLVESDTFGKDLHQYTRGLITLRKALPVFRLGSAIEIEKRLSLLPGKEGQSPLTLAYTLEASPEEKYLILVNAETNEQVFNYNSDDNRLLIITDGRETDLNGINRSKTVSLSKEQIILQPLTAAILKIQ